MAAEENIKKPAMTRMPVERRNGMSILRRFIVSKSSETENLFLDTCFSVTGIFSCWKISSLSCIHSFRDVPEKQDASTRFLSLTF